MGMEVGRGGEMTGTGGTGSGARGSGAAGLAEGPLAAGLADEALAGGLADEALAAGLALRFITGPFAARGSTAYSPFAALACGSAATCGPDEGLLLCRPGLAAWGGGCAASIIWAIPNLPVLAICVAI